MRIEISPHAMERMQKYEVTENAVKNAVAYPDSIVSGEYGRLIYQRRLNGYLLRVIVEENEGIIRVVTVYKARRERYEI